MNIQFRQGSETLSEKLIERAQTKIAKIGRFVAERNYEAQVHVDVDRESSANNSESRWRASLNLDLAGDRLHVTALASTPDKAVDLALKELKQEVRRSNTKHATLVKKGGSIFKRLQQQFS